MVETFSLDHDCNQVSENAYYSSSDKNKDQYPGYSFLKVGVLTEKVSCIEQETNQENYSKDDREDCSNGIRNVINRIFYPTDLCKNRSGAQEDKRS